MAVCSRQLSTLLKGESPCQTPSHDEMCFKPTCIMPLEPENGKDFVSLCRYVRMYVCTFVYMY